MSKRFLDIFLFSVLYGMITMIIVSLLYYFGINLIGDVAATILLVGVISIFLSNTICKYLTYDNDLPLYSLGYTEAGIEYRKKLLSIAQEAESNFLDITVKYPQNMPKSYNEWYSYLYALAYAKSRNELIKKISKAFDEVDDFSSTEKSDTK